jgi:hypothetical protein
MACPDIKRFNVGYLSRVFLNLCCIQKTDPNVMGCS